MYMEPGKPPMVSEGTETNTLVAGGLWLKSELHALVDKDHRTRSFYMKAKDGSFVKIMDMEYTRAK